MTYERFKEIQIEEKITNEIFINELWEARPYDDLNEDSLRETCRWIIHQEVYKKYLRTSDINLLR